MSSSPAIIRRVVVFPHPLGPTRTPNSPSRMFIEKSWPATNSPKCFVTFSRSIFAPPPPLHGAFREPRHEILLENNEEDDDRQGHEDRDRRELVPEHLRRLAGWAHAPGA